jgi:hypothetical protein
MNKALFNKFIPVISVFIVINLLLVFCRTFLASNGFNISFLWAANIILFLLSGFGFFIQNKGVNSANVNAFVRGLYSSLLLKMGVIIGALLVYILVIGGAVSQASLFTVMGIYLIYTSIEVVQLMKIARNKPDA